MSRAECCGVLEKMSGDQFVVHCVLHAVTGLVRFRQRKTVEGARVGFFADICDNTDNSLRVRYFLIIEQRFMTIPSFTHLSPMCACNTLHQSVYGPKK